MGLAVITCVSERSGAQTKVGKGSARCDCTAIQIVTTASAEVVKISKAPRCETPRKEGLVLLMQSVA